MLKIIPMMMLIFLVFTQLSFAETDELSALKEQLSEQAEKLQETA